MSDGRVVIDIGADTTEYEREIGKLRSITEERVQLISKGLITAGKAMTTALTAPILAFGALAVKAAIDFESSFAGVRKTVDATEEEYEALAQAAKDMSEQKIVSANQISEIMALGGQLGISKENLVDFAGVIADLDVATNMNMEQAATEIAQYANVTQMAQDDIDNFASTIVELGNNAATTEADIMAMAMRIGGAGSQIGMTDAEILALSSSLASVGISAEAGGTAISTIMSQIDKDVALNTETVRVWADVTNMSVEEFSEAWTTRPVEALQAVFTGMSDVQQSGGNLNIVLDQLGVTSLRQTDVMKRLGNASALFGSQIELASDAWEANIALSSEAEKRYQTTEGEMGIFKNQLTNIAAEMGGPLVGALNNALSAAQPILDVIKNMASAFNNASPATQGLVMGLVGLVAALGPMMAAFGKMKELGSNFRTWISNVAAATHEEERAVVSATGARERETAATEVATTAKTTETTATKGAAAAKTTETTATKTNTTAKTANTAATKGATGAKVTETTATKGGAAAEAAHTTVKAAAIPVTTALATATNFLSKALASTPIGPIVIGLSLLLPLVTMLAGALGDATSGTGQFTEATKRQKKAVDDAQKTYDAAVDAHGELSDEALAAKGALDAESAAFEATKKTVGELTEEINKDIEAHQQLMESINDGYEAADAETGALLHLQSTILDLAAASDGSAQSEGELAAQIAALNELSPAAAELIDAQTLAQGDLTTSSIEQREAYEQQIEALNTLIQTEKARIQIDAAQDAYVELIREEITLTNDLAAAEAEREALGERPRQGTGAVHGAIYIDTSAWDTADAQINTLNASLAENAAAQAAASIRASELASHQIRVEQAAKKAASGYHYTTEELEMLGITESEVATEVARAEAEKTAAVEEAKNAMVEAIEEYMGKNADFVQAMADSGLSSDELGRRLSDLGLSFGDLSGEIDNAVARATDGFNRLESDSETSLSDWVANLEANQQTAEAWGANLQGVFSRTGVSFSDEFINEIRSGGVEKYGSLLSQMVNLTDTELQDVVDQFNSTGTAATDAIVGSFGDIDLADEGAAAIASFNEGATAAAEEESTARQAIVTTFTTSITAAAPEVEAAVTQMLNTAITGASEASFAPLGTQAMTQFAEGIHAGQEIPLRAVRILATTLTTAIGAMKLAPVGAKLAANLASGITQGTPGVVAAASRQVTAAIDAAKTASNNTSSIGYQMSSGIAQGVYSGGSLIANALRYVIKQGMIAARELGVPIPQGVALGILQASPVVGSAMEKMMDGAFDVSGFAVDLGSLSARGALAVGGTVTNNYYTVGSVDMTGDVRAESAVDVFMDRLERRGRM
ncbi:MAG: phage tail tape measure protein [Coriobacteriales bacterium]|jgi:TP901 family phage tail tape measure protein|nr:phage tail tape measure protein [Coriobacteriales bacterium]